MDLLTNNFITNMYGPHFLILYSATIVVTLTVCWWKLRELDSYSDLPTVPADPDPYEIAYLLGSEDQVIRVVILNLIQRGYLQIDPEEQNIHRVEDSPSLSSLAELEQSVYKWFSTSRTAGEIFTSKLPSIVKNHCIAYKERLQLEKLLVPESIMFPARKICIGSAAVIIGLGGYKLLAALFNGHYNVFFLALLGSFGILTLQSLWYKFNRRRLSRRGDAYIEKLRETFDVPDDEISTLAAAGTDKQLLLLVGLFGVGVLAHTSLNYYPSIFQTGARHIYGGCGGAYIAGWGGCGGGGCGGGGCGGCGGG